MAYNADAPILIKKVKKSAAHGHHGGAWKVAYADFVTAMMAFFLLMWLINTTSPQQKRGIADYFAPASVSESGAQLWATRAPRATAHKP
jgi:chemotaxis protein MotB